MRIDSPKNEKIRLLCGLAEAKLRRESGLFAVEGTKLVTEALEAGWPIEFALIEEGHARCGPLAEQLRGADIPLYEASARAFAAAALTEAPQGIMAAVRMRESGPVTSPVIILDGVQDPGNVGTILRTAEAACFGGAILGNGCAEPFSPKVVRSTMGSIFRLPVLYGCELTALLSQWKEDGWQIAGTALSGTDFFDREIVCAKRLCLVIGSEGRGISSEVLALCDNVYRLPMGGSAESLNAAVSAGIMMYDCFRRGDGRNH